MKQRASKSLFSSAKETALFRADSIKGNGCYLEELLCLHFKGLVLLLDWYCFMQLLNEKHLFGIRPREQIRFSLDSLSMWESLCDCPDLCGVIKITTLTSALSNAVLKENIKIIQIYYKFRGFISPSGFRSLIFLLNFWTQLEINCNSERFESFSCSLALTDVPFRLCQCPIIANSSGCFCHRVLEGFSLYQRGKWWKCGKENDHNHVRYFLPFASLVSSLRKGCSASTEYSHYRWPQMKVKVYL